MIGEIGQTSLILALVSGLLGCLFNKINSRKLVLFWLMVAGAALIASFLTDDFSLEYIAKHSNSNLALHYKFAGLWAGHEGSMLLWCLLLSLVLCLLPTFDNVWKNFFYSNSFLSYLIFFANPFKRVSDGGFIEGFDLNPLLQDNMITIHPPILFTGYILTFAVYYLGQQAHSKQTYDNVLKLFGYARISWIFLSIGILLGGAWAYYELGWGGYWFWDPVENLSLVPWLFLTAFVHKKPKLDNISYILSQLPFLSVNFATFTVRSGLIDSVHSFASNADKALPIFLILIIFCLCSVLSKPKHALRINIKSYLMLVPVISLSVGSILLLVGTTLPTVIKFITNNQNIEVSNTFYNAISIIIALINCLCIVLAINKKIISTNKKIIHIGVIIFMLSIGVNQLLSKQSVLLLPINSTVNIFGKDMTLLGTEIDQRDNYLSKKFLIKIDDEIIYPEKRYFFTTMQWTSELAIYNSYCDQLLISINDKVVDKWQVQIFHKPFIHLILVGIYLVMGSYLFGMISKLLFKYRFQRVEAKLYE